MPTSTARPLAVLTSLFFLWGFITVLNDVLVPHWKQLFELSYAQSLLVQFCFFGAYFIGSLAYYLISVSSSDPIARIGYKQGLILGLVISALGCALFAPATVLHSYAAHLAALFVLGLGFTVLQIAANPFVAIIGPPESASSRLNLAQAFNSLGTTLAPLIGGWFIFNQVDPTTAVRLPYLGLAAVLVVIAFVVRLTRLPEPPRVDSPSTGKALRHPQLRWGMLAIFCYVGAEVAIGSLIISFLGLEHILGLGEDDAKHYLSLYWGGAMTGRFLGAIALAKGWPMAKRVLAMVAVGAAMFILLVALNAGSALGLEQAWPMALLILLNMAAFVLAGPNASRALGLFATVAMVLLGIVVAGEGLIAVWAIIAIGLFNSILWSNIFTLAIDGLGEDTAQGSSLLVMMIVGGALVPPLQGAIIDLVGVQDGAMTGFHGSFVLPMICYAYLAWYGFKGFTPTDDHGMILGIDIGGTTSKLGLVHHGQVIARARIATEGHADDRAFTDALAQAAHELIRSKDLPPLQAVGIGAPNANQLTGIIEMAPNLPWKYDVPLARMMADRLGVPAVLGNDANAAALGEWRYGAGQGFRDLLVVTLGTGVGSGFIVNGQLVLGSAGNAGELGHVIMDVNGRACTCGRRGCLEAYVSIRGMRQTYAELSGVTEGQGILSATGVLPIAEAARSGDAAALATFERTVGWLAVGLANAVCATGPGRIVLFGGIARNGELLMAPLRERFHEALLNIYRGRVDITVSALPDDDAALLGAAALGSLST